MVHIEPDGELVFEGKIEIPKYKYIFKILNSYLNCKNLIEENYPEAFRTTGISENLEKKLMFFKKIF